MPPSNPPSAAPSSSTLTASPYAAATWKSTHPGGSWVSWGVAGSIELPPGVTQVEFTLTPTPAGTHLRLVHSGLPPSQAPMHATGWKHFLPRLSLAAAGTDPGSDPWNPASWPPRPGRGV